MLAFDSKYFQRRRIVQDIDPVTKDPYLVEESTFYTPLGVGVQFNDTAAFRDVCVKRVKELAAQFQLTQKRIIYDSYSLREELGHYKPYLFATN